MHTNTRTHTHTHTHTGHRQWGPGRGCGLWCVQGCYCCFWKTLIFSYIYRLICSHGRSFMRYLYVYINILIRSYIYTFIHSCFYISIWILTHTFISLLWVSRSPSVSLWRGEEGEVMEGWGEMEGEGWRRDGDCVKRFGTGGMGG